VSQKETSRVAQELLTCLRAGASPNEIAVLCSPHLDRNIPGDTGVLPWIGRRTGRSAISDFIRFSDCLKIKVDSLRRAVSRRLWRIGADDGLAARALLPRACARLP
jgi:hypothetical protein